MGHGRAIGSAKNFFDDDVGGAINLFVIAFCIVDHFFIIVIGLLLTLLTLLTQDTLNFVRWVGTLLEGAKFIGFI